MAYRDDIHSDLAMLMLGVDPRKIDHCRHEQAHAMDVLRGQPKRDRDFLGVIDMVSSGLRPAGKPIRPPREQVPKRTAPIGVDVDNYKNGGLP